MKKSVKPLKKVEPLKRVKPLERKGNIIDRQTQAAKGKKTPTAARKYNKGGMVKKGKAC